MDPDQAYSGDRAEGGKHRRGPSAISQGTSRSDGSSTAPVKLKSKPSHADAQIFRKASTVFRHKPTADEDPGMRYITFNDFAKNGKRLFISNILKTTKYNALNIIPKSIFEQFKRVSNFYFLCVCIVSFIPGVSPTSPITNLLPLIFVVGFGMLRDVYEDSIRYRADRKGNLAPVVMVTRNSTYSAPKGLFSCSSKPIDMSKAAADLPRPPPPFCEVAAAQDLLVGDIVKIHKGETFPADLMVLMSSEEGGVCYVSTANLDGESNLKRHTVIELTKDITDPSTLTDVQGEIICQLPDPALHAFQGQVVSPENPSPMPLSSDNLVLRGCILKNTDYIFAMVVYSGYDTKVALNMRDPPSKMGQVEYMLNKVVLALFGLLFLIIVAYSLVAGVLQKNNAKEMWYIGSYGQDSGGTVSAKSLGTFFILFATFIPISLFVSLEFVRVFQAGFMTWDRNMEANGNKISVKATNLNEMLGNVQHILSDKTGTLTDNIMCYVACSVNNEILDIRETPTVMQDKVAAGDEGVRLLVRAMGLCHSVVPEVPEDAEEGQEPIAAGSESAPKEIEYQGQSPDEVTLVTSARDFGVELLGRTLDTITVNEFGVQKEYKMLAELEFNSDRKRMSMIFRDPEGKIMLYCKGADSIMMPLMKPGPHEDSLHEHVHNFAVKGLRTLVFAYKELETAEYEMWFSKFQEARGSIGDDRNEKVDEVSAVLETDMQFVACTAVEDKLQDRCPETIQALRDAGLRLWVLTGDKRETAENIGYSANLIDRRMRVFHFTFDSAEECEDILHEHIDIVERGVYVPDQEQESSNAPKKAPGHTRKQSAIGKSLRKIFKPRPKEFAEIACIIDGPSLAYVLESQSELFMDFADKCKTVVCCRVTPLQKALVVRMVRNLRNANTLAVGDGGNDVSMIQEAHIGVGIYGREGAQAARAADYAIGGFRILERLLLVHGRYAYVRTCLTIIMSFYKNLQFTLLQMYFQYFAFFSGVTLHNQWTISLFNLLLTAVSPVVVGVLEKDLLESTLSANPGIYHSNLGGRLFNFAVMAEMFGYALWHSFCIFFGWYCAMEGFTPSAYLNGKVLGLHAFAGANSSLSLFIVLSKFMLMAHTWTWLFLISIAIGYICLVILFAVTPTSLLKDYAQSGVLYQLVTCPVYWLGIVLISTVAFLPDFIVLMYRRIFKADKVMILQERENREHPNPSLSCP